MAYYRYVCHVGAWSQRSKLFKPNALLSNMNYPCNLLLCCSELSSDLIRMPLLFFNWDVYLVCMNYFLIKVYLQLLFVSISSAPPLLLMHHLIHHQLSDIPNTLSTLTDAVSAAEQLMSLDHWSRLISLCIINWTIITILQFILWKYNCWGVFDRPHTLLYTQLNMYITLYLYRRIVPVLFHRFSLLSLSSTQGQVIDKGPTNSTL